jgi:hypothetical protein
MKIDEKGLGLDSKRIIRRAITIANSRDQYFNDLIGQFRKKMPSLKIIYANDTMGAKLNPEHPTPDFVLICKGTLVSRDPQKPPKKIVMLDAPMTFTERSIAGWTLAVEQGNLDGYFRFMLDKMLRMDESKFYEYVQHMALLSLDPNDERYWKRLENTPKLTRDLEELYARYTKRESTRIKDKRGYGAVRQETEPPQNKDN